MAIKKIVINVVIIDPMNCAVALMYDNTKDSAPIVLAKEQNVLENRLQNVGQKKGFFTITNPSLARYLYRNGRINRPIPENMFTAVAEELAYALKGKRGRR